MNNEKRAVEKIANKNSQSYRIGARYIEFFSGKNFAHLFKSKKDVEQGNVLAVVRNIPGRQSKIALNPARRKAATKRKNPVLKSKIAYFPTFEDARAFGRAHAKGFPSHRAVQYLKGWAVQLYPSGPYLTEHGEPSTSPQRKNPARRKTATKRKNPAEKPVLLYTVQIKQSPRPGAPWVTKSVFTARADAFEYARAYARAHRVQVQVIT